MRWHVVVALHALYFLMVGKVSLRLVNCDNRVLLALSRLRKRIVNNTMQYGDTVENWGPHLAPLAKESDIIDPSCLCTLRCWEEQRYGGHTREFRGPARRKAEWA